MDADMAAIVTVLEAYSKSRREALVTTFANDHTAYARKFGQAEAAKEAVTLVLEKIKAMGMDEG